MIKRFIFTILFVFIVTILAFRAAAAWRESTEPSDAYPPEGRVVQTQMGGVYIEESGPATGVPVLLVHGSIGWSGLWRETTDALADAGFRAIAFDMPPMGYSDRDPGGDYSRQTQANRLLSLIQALNIRPLLVAHSFGAGPATEAVMLSSDQFAGLILVDAALGIGSDDNPRQLNPMLRPQIVREFLMSLSVTNPMATKFLLAKFLYRKDRANDYYADILQRPMVLKETTAELARWLPTLLVAPVGAKSTRLENYNKIGLPVAILWGEQDTITPPDQARVLFDNIAGAKLVMLADVGHIPQIEDPQQFNTALIEALKGMENQN